MFCVPLTASAERRTANFTSTTLFVAGIACVRWKQTASLFSLAFFSNSNPQESHSCMHLSLPATLQRLHGVIRVAGRSAPFDSEEFKREPVVESTQHTHTTHTHTPHATGKEWTAVF